MINFKLLEKIKSDKKSLLITVYVSCSVSEYGQSYMNLLKHTFWLYINNVLEMRLSLKISYYALYKTMEFLQNYKQILVSDRTVLK